MQLSMYIQKDLVFEPADKGAGPELVLQGSCIEIEARMNNLYVRTV